MRCTLMLFLTLLIETAPAVAQAVSSDSQMAQTMLTEIRELRQDLRNTAATIQRVQIVMYRLQVQGAFVDKAAQRLDQARSQCKEIEARQKFLAIQFEQAEARKQNPQNASDQKAAEQMISQLQLSKETFAGETQQCQGEQADADTQFRAEQGKMDELAGQLDQLDRVLASRSSK